MEPLDLTKLPPRPPHEELDGLIFLPRTIDKLRASLPGGNRGDYSIAGFSVAMFETIGVSEEQMLGAVLEAATDEDVARWLRGHADTAKYAVFKTWLESRELNDENRERLHKRYPVCARDSALIKLIDILRADDRECFASPR
ncbi:MAG: DUF5069 domain-containing protein [bacterium]|nr:DUF5069 domain-containing protein [bacterium]